MSRAKGNAPAVRAAEASGDRSQKAKGQIMLNSNLKSKNNVNNWSPDENLRGMAERNGGMFDDSSAGCDIGESCSGVGGIPGGSQPVGGAVGCAVGNWSSSVSTGQGGVRVSRAGGDAVGSHAKQQVGKPKAFKFDETEVRVFVIDGNPWFGAKDLCNALGLTNSRKALKALSVDEKGVTSSYSLGGEQEISIVSEGGMWTLVLRCRDAVIEGTVPFRVRKWVTGEVLPAIRKTGVYVGRPFSVNPSDTLTAEEQNKLRAMLREAAEKLPKERQAAAIISGWSKLKSHFKVSYREIPRSEFVEAISIVARHTAEWEVVDAAPKRRAYQIVVEDSRVVSSYEVDLTSVAINFDDDQSVSDAMKYIPTDRIKRVTEIVTGHALGVMDHQLQQLAKA